MRSSVTVLSSRRGVAPAVCSGASSAPSRARRVVAAAALPQRRRPRSGLPTTEKASSTMQVKALSGDETGLVTALSSAPPEAMYALGAVLVGLGAIVASALAGEKKSSPAGGPSSSSFSASSAPPPPPPRRDAVAIFGASGKVGRQIVKSLLLSSSTSKRTVVAAVRSAERAREVFSEIGIDVEAALRTGSLSIIGGVDVTNAATLSPNPELWEGVSQAAVSLGPVFARLPGGGMGYLDGMTSEAVDARGVAALVEAMKKEMRAVPGATDGGETTPLVPMGSAADLEARWDALDDVIMGGKSSSSLSVLVPEGGEGGEGGGSGRGGAVWEGELVLEGGGFCGTRTKKGALGVAFGPPSAEAGAPPPPSAPSALSSLPRFDGVELRVRSDRGQTFKLNLKTAAQEDVPEATYQALVDTAPGGAWATVRLPWSAFVATRRARFDAAAPPLAEVARAGGPAAVISQVGLVLSRFEFDGAPNLRCGGPGAFRLEVGGGGIGLFREAAALRRPACVLLTSAAIERNARIGDDAARRAADVPIVRLNPGGALNWKYVGEAALRHSGLSYAVVRATGLIDEEAAPAAAAASDPAAPPAPPVAYPIEAGQGDTISGVISRPEAARVVVAALDPVSPAASAGSPSAAFPASPIGKTIEVRRGLPADAERLGPGRGSDAAALASLWRRAVPDRERHLFGLPPLPAPCPPPPPPAEEEVRRVLADPRVAAAAAAADNARGGRVRSEEEASRAGSVVVANDGRERASERAAAEETSGSDGDDDDNTPPPPPSKSSAPIPENVAEAKEWVAAWRAQSAQ